MSSYLSVPLYILLYFFEFVKDSWFRMQKVLKRGRKISFTPNFPIARPPSGPASWLLPEVGYAQINTHADIFPSLNTHRDSTVHCCTTVPHLALVNNSPSSISEKLVKNIFLVPLVMWHSVVEDVARGHITRVCMMCSLP